MKYVCLPGSRADYTFFIDIFRSANASTIRSKQ